MSEIQETVQIIEISAKGGYWGVRIAKEAMLAFVKLLNTLYLAKWKGDTSLRRFQAIRGNEMQFFNIGTEDKAALKAIYQSMKEHGILVGRLPDLCGGDGKTQVVISPCDMSKMESFLLDHQKGKYGDIKINPISAADYERTGHTPEGELTPEYANLEKSAERKRMKGLSDKNKGAKLLTEPKGISEFLMAIRQKERCEKAEAEKVRIHHDEAYCGSNRNWITYSVEDGKRAVFIPKKNISDKDSNGMVTAVIDKKAEYFCVDKSNGEITRIKGKDVVEALRKEPVKIRYKKAKNLVKNTPKVVSVTRSLTK